MDLGLRKDQLIDILKDADLSEASKQKIAEAIEQNNKKIERNLDAFLGKIYRDKGRPQGR